MEIEVLAPPWSLTPRAFECSAGSAGDERPSYVGDTLLTSVSMPPASDAPVCLYMLQPVVRLHACGWWSPPVRQKATDVVLVCALLLMIRAMDASVQCRARTAL